MRRNGGHIIISYSGGTASFHEAVVFSRTIIISRSSNTSKKHEQSSKVTNRARAEGCMCAIRWVCYHALDSMPASGAQENVCTCSSLRLNQAHCIDVSKMPASHIRFVHPKREVVCPPHPTSHPRETLSLSCLLPTRWGCPSQCF